MLSLKRMIKPKLRNHPMKNDHFELTVEDIVLEGERIDVYLKTVFMDIDYPISRNMIQKSFEKGLVLVNQNLVKPSYKVKLNDKIDFTYEVEATDNIEKQNIPLDIVYEDDDLLIINKPSGMVVHPSVGHYLDTLVNGLLYYSDSLSDVNGEFRPGIVHRIDKDTSGLLIVCKNNFTHNIIAEEIKEKIAKREYLAIVSGNFENTYGKIDAPIGRNPQNRKLMAVCENGKESVTHFEVLESFKGYSLLKCKLETGRTHQIRVHLAFIHHPVLNDPDYATTKPFNDFYQYLHAYHLQLVHPRTKEVMDFYAEAPREFLELLDELRNLSK